MAEGTLSSAVIVPEQENQLPSPEPGLKRRQSSTTDPDSDIKRRRLSTQNDDQDPEQPPARRPSSPKQEAQDTERKRNRRDEERKRGQRLFGSLLGTLSQSSNSAAQRRRADIERKQQDKLKLQDEEYGELKKKRLEERFATRKKEQKVYEKEMMHTRHENLLAMAHFLKTKSEPVLYYKPWQLRPEEDDTIQDQIRQAEATIAREVEEFDARNAQEDQPETEKHDQTEETQEKPEQPELSQNAQNDQAQEQKESVAAEPNHEKEPDEAKPDGPSAEATSAGSHQQEDHRGAEDDGGEVVEDNEDTVIY
ncbi:pinin/SDK/memA/ protein conserved region-domain-containing protein [Aspergillus falconensis]